MTTTTVELYIQTTHPKDTCFKPACFLIILPFIRPFYRLARLAKMAGSNTRDGLTSRGFMGFGNDSSDNRQAEHNLEENGGAANKNAALLMSSNGDKGKSKWGNIMQISSSANKSGKLSGQSTLSEEEDLPKAQGSSGEDSTFPIDTQQPLRQSSKKDKYSKGRNPASSSGIQSLNPTQLQPPSSILKVEEIPSCQTTESRKQLLQRTFRVDMNDPEQPLLGGEGQELDTIHTAEVAGNTQTDSESPVPYGVIPRSLKKPAQVNSGWL